MISRSSIRLTLLVILLLGIESWYGLRSNAVFVTPSKEYHIVRHGDTLFSISKKHGIPVNKLKLYNNLTSDNIFVGQKIYLTPHIEQKSEFVTRRAIPESRYHLVQKGETVYRISRIYDVEILDILDYNNLETFDIKTGQKIWLEPGHIAGSKPETPGLETPSSTPKSSGDYHIVKKGETLYRISRMYDMKVDELKRLNDLKSDNIEIGQKLMVRGERCEIVEKTPPPPVNVQKPQGIISPLKGRITSKFGIRAGKPHKGLDIAAPIGEPISAVMDGKVAFAGRQRGYGNVVIIEHKDYIMTVYAHNDANLVRLGDSVKKGQPIATVGNTGKSTGPHLHFEYRVQGKAIDPLTVLPPIEAP